MWAYPSERSGLYPSERTGLYPSESGLYPSERGSQFRSIESEGYESGKETTRLTSEKQMKMHQSASLPRLEPLLAHPSEMRRSPSVGRAGLKKYTKSVQGERHVRQRRSRARRGCLAAPAVADGGESHDSSARATRECRPARLVRATRARDRTRRWRQSYESGDGVRGRGIYRGNEIELERETETWISASGGLGWPSQERPWATPLAAAPGGHGTAPQQRSRQSSACTATVATREPPE